MGGNRGLGIVWGICLEGQGVLDGLSVRTMHRIEARLAHHCHHFHHCHPTDPLLTLLVSGSKRLYKAIAGQGLLRHEASVDTHANAMSTSGFHGFGRRRSSTNFIIKTP